MKSKKTGNWQVVQQEETVQASAAGALAGSTSLPVSFQAPVSTRGSAVASGKLATCGLPDGASIARV